MFSNWTELPKDIVCKFANKLTDIQDYIHFGAVCTSWKSHYTQNLPHYSPPTQVPLLMISTDENDQNNNQEHELIYKDRKIKTHTHSFYSLFERRVCNFRATLPDNMICRGSSHGWLFIVNQSGTEARLFNPFLLVNNQIELPTLTSLEVHRDYEDELRDEFFLCKAVLSADPLSNPDCLVMIIYGKQKELAFVKGGDKSWTPTVGKRDLQNVIYYNDRLYAVAIDEELFTCDVNHPQPNLSKVAPHPNSLSVFKFKMYLLKSSGDLLLITRMVDVLSTEEPTYFTTGFQIFKLNPADSKWVEVKSLCGHSLFLGENSSICLPSSDFPGCKPNSIYFTDDFYEGYAFDEGQGSELYDIGVFTLEDGRVERNYPMQYKMKFAPPIWIEPTLQRSFN